jgi:hypothetical protein
MFSEEEKAIFVFQDGEKERRCDPLVMRRRLLRASTGQLSQLLQNAAEPRRSPDEPPEPPGAVLERLDAQEQLVAVLREAFELPEPAFTEATVLRVWSEWTEWVKKKGRMRRNSPTSSPATESCPAPA